MADTRTGISIRYVQQFDSAEHTEIQRWPAETLEQQARRLALCDGRDIPFAERLADAMQFLSEIR